MEYYYKAISYLTENVCNVRFYIFSDNIEWVSKNLNIGTDHVFVSENYTKHDIEDFYLMQQCKYHIIANSTLNWWAAWLCTCHDKIVIATSNGSLNETSIGDRSQKHG